MKYIRICTVLLTTCATTSNVKNNIIAQIPIPEDWRMKCVEVYVVSAFSKDNEGGNKAGVVLECTGLSPVQKMQIAKELGYSETAFVSASENADFRLEYFTPTDEVPLCGHATIATFSLLNLLGKLERQQYTIETKAGILNMEILEDGMVFMEQNCPGYLDILETEVFADCMQIEVSDQKLPIQIVTTGLKDILFPVNTVDDLAGLEPDFDKMTELSRELDVVGVHAFSLVKNREMDAVCRNFAPLYGIDEESATGTASCALASYLFKHVEKKSRYIFEQGYNLQLPSRIVVKLDCQNEEITAIFVGGYGYLVSKRAIPL